MDGHPLCCAGLGVHLGGYFVGIPHHDKGFTRLPEMKQFLVSARFAPFQQGLVGRQLFGGRGQGTGGGGGGFD